MNALWPEKMSAWLDEHDAAIEREIAADELAAAADAAAPRRSTMGPADHGRLPCSPRSRVAATPDAAAGQAKTCLAADPRQKAMADALALAAAAGRASRRAGEATGGWFCNPVRYRRLFRKFLREEERGADQ